MSCLFPRSNGIWYIATQKHGRSEWRSTGTRCFGSAVKIYKSSGVTRRVRGPVRISDFRARFEEYASVNLASGTRKLYAQSFTSFLRVVSDKPLKLVTVLDVERFKLARSKSVSPVTLNIEFRCLRAAFNVACRWGLLGENVFRQSKQLRIPVKEPVFLTMEEMSTLLRSIGDPAFQELLTFAVSTMMRRGEILNLAWEDIDFERQVIHVRNKQQFVVKGYKPRVIPMNKDLCRMLSKRRLDLGFVFAKRDGRKLLGSSVSNKFKSFVRKCKLSESIHFHSLRHTGASWLIQQDVPIYSVQKLLGHSSPSVTQIYAHLSDHSLRRAVDLIGIYSPSLSLN